MNHTFTCDECGKEKPLKDLSQGSRKTAGKNLPSEAIQVLPAYDILCQKCQSLVEGAVEETYEPRPRLTSLQSWYYSGLTLDGATLDWLALNF